MSFKIQEKGSGFFWASGGDRIRLASEGSTYEIDSEGHIRNVDNGLYVRHSYWILSEVELAPSEDNDFKWVVSDSGLIESHYDGVWCVTPENDFFKLKKGDVFYWNIIKEVADEDVPVSRASALIEEALNAKAASCGCECGCGPNCEGCECECGCPKALP